jgi:hypothetical protein
MEALLLLRLALLIVCTLLVLQRAVRRATTEANIIHGSSEPLGYWWHVLMWVAGKAGTGIVCVIIYGLATGVYGGMAMGFYSMMLYWLCFDLFLNKERGKRLWYISSGKETALSDQLLYWIRRKTGLTEQETHLTVKLPLILIGLLACLIAAL